MQRQVEDLLKSTADSAAQADQLDTALKQTQKLEVIEEEKNELENEQYVQIIEQKNLQIEEMEVETEDLKQKLYELSLKLKGNFTSHSLTVSEMERQQTFMTEANTQDMETEE